MRAGGGVYLYYAAAGGVGLATSSDGFAFTKHGAPVLAPDATAAWETTPPSAPSVAIFPGGTWHMLYAAGVAIGEATSADGVTWTRVDGDPTTAAIDPILAPSPFDPAHPDVDAGGAFDTGQVSDPCVSPRVTPAGRLEVRVLYTGYDGPPGAADRASAVGLAARYGDTGALERRDVARLRVGRARAGARALRVVDRLDALRHRGRDEPPLADVPRRRRRVLAGRPDPPAPVATASGP